MKILFLSQRVPYPPNRGDKITTWHLIERMRRQHDVTVITFAHDAEDRRAVKELHKLEIATVAVPHDEAIKKVLALPLLLSSKPLTLGVYSSRRLRATVAERIGEAQVAYAYSSSMGAFLLPHATPWVMHFAELDSDKWGQYAERARFPMRAVYRREQRTLLAFERRLAEAARTNVLCTRAEEQLFQERIPGVPSTVLQNGVDLEHFRPAGAEPEHGRIVFTGVMDYLPNVDGCTWFVREILPRIRNEFPKARFVIVGARPTPAVRRLAQVPGVSVTGTVEDTRVPLRRAELAVAPLRIARGIQNKVLEAMAMGLALVGTSSATRGVGALPGRDYLVADDADGLAEAVRGLLRDPARARQMGDDARRFVQQHFDWESVLEPLDEILERAAKPGPGVSPS